MLQLRIRGVIQLQATQATSYELRATSYKWLRYVRKALVAREVAFLNKSSLEYCGIGGYSLFLREIKCKDYEYFSFHRRISEEP